MAHCYVSEDFLLKTPLAEKLYHQHASAMPIIDYHSHLEAEDIYLNQSHENITQVWLASDHYIWRAMRSVGIDEHYITGNASDQDKFAKWCEAMPKLIGSPLYQWCHLELKKYFNIDVLICPENQEFLWNQCNEVITAQVLTPQNVLKMNKVHTVCTTDDPTSSLEFHQKLASEPCSANVLPTFRFDGLINLSNLENYGHYLDRLSECVDYEIKNLASLKSAIRERIAFFDSVGCKVSDVGLNDFQFIVSSEESVAASFELMRSGIPLLEEECLAIRSHLLVFLGQCFCEFGWAMQIHHGVLMNVNERRFETLGPATGFSVMDDAPLIRPLSKFLSQLDLVNKLPSTILYSLNPKDTWPLASLIGAFQESGSASKIQLGAGWWFNDHKHGIMAQMTALANLGALGCFVGMLTDSRNILSMSRHDYFRRVLCDMLADWALSGDVPNDEALLSETIKNICFSNAKQYFDFH
ncbi:glucuronate isomerase [uncultured Vibrio sp.]|uniref:glucuronate isomerase n=1 Tax=uncultured Vibrio sp. TaxID=114054 RepID=UPI00262D5DFE|nr:glucuronate isomerase [uncultured Vibrio sp.]